MPWDGAENAKKIPENNTAVMASVVLGDLGGVGPLPHPRKATVRRLRVARPLEEGSGTGPLNTETQPRDAWGRSEVTSSPWIA